MKRNSLNPVKQEISCSTLSAMYWKTIRLLPMTSPSGSTGVYDKSIEVVGGEGHASASLGNIQIEADQLRISLSGLNDTNILPGNDYTYEVWIWVNNVKPANDGTGAYIELFDAAMKNLWVGGQPGADNDPYGEDITANYVTVASPAGYAVRYNVYRGISGSPYTSEPTRGLSRHWATRLTSRYPSTFRRTPRPKRTQPRPFTRVSRNNVQRMPAKAD